MATIVLHELTLESGRTLRQVPIAYHTWGRLNENRDNVILICHALTGNTRADEWWSPLVGAGRLFDTDRYYVICPNVLGSPYGSASPLTPDVETGEPHGPRFARVTIRDTVAAHRELLAHLGVRQVAAVVGGSMGGMQVLEWAFHGDYVRSLIPIAVGGRHSAWCIGWSEAQRQAIYADPKWQAGRYDPKDPPVAGLAAARMAAMISYRSRASFEDRFGRTMQEGESGLFAVESYLRYQGQKLVNRFDANCYVSLTLQMDTHDVARGRGTYEDVLARITQPTLVIGIDSDVLYPLCEQQELALHLPHASLAVLNSPHGHDAFLLDTDQLQKHVDPWLRTHAAVEEAPSNRLAAGNAQ